MRRQKLVSTGNEAVIEQREREIEEIAQGIIEMAGIFQELQTMIIDQGTMLDRIDYNVERMGTEVKGAEKELTIATNYQRRSVKRKIMLLLVIIIAGMIILLGLKLGSRGGDGGNSDSPPANPAPPQNNNNDAMPPMANVPPVGGERALFRSRLRRSSLQSSGSSLSHKKDWRRRRRWRQNHLSG